MWFIELVVGGTETIVTDLFNALFAYISSFFSGNMVIDLLNNSAVVTANNVVTGISTTFIGVLAAKKIITTYILETDGDSDMDPFQYLVKASISLAMIQMCSPLTKYLIRLSGLAFRAAGGESLYNVTSSEEITSLDKASAFVSQRTTSDIYETIFCICIIILMVRGAFRVAEIAAMNVLFPLFACDIITAGRERWNAFFTGFLTTIFGYVIQLLMLNLSLRLYVSADSMYSIVLSVGCLFFSIKSPKWLDKFVYTTGLGQSAGHSAMYMVPQLLRMVK